MLFFKSKYEIYKSKIKIGNKKLPFLISFQKISYQISALQIKKEFGSLEFFKKWFNKLMVPIIKNVFESDELLAKISHKIKKIKIELYPTLLPTGIKTLDEAMPSFYGDQIGGYCLNLTISLKTDDMMEYMKDFFKTGKFQTQNLSKIVKHELSHFYDEIVGHSAKEDFKDVFPMSEIKKKNFDSYWVFRDFLIKCRKEGVASFKQYRYRERIPINGYSTLWFKNPYVFGQHMCTIIALYILKKENRLNEVYIIKGNEQVPIEQLNKLLAEGAYFYITKIPDDIHLKAARIVSRLNPLNFLKLYDLACDKLGIQRRNKGILSLASYQNLEKKQ